jgi:hypothetical protein
MPRRTLSIIAALLTACTTATRVSVAPNELSTLTGLGANEERSVLPVGRAERVTVRGNDGIRLQTKSGSLPMASPGTSNAWAQIDTLRAANGKVSLTWLVDADEGQFATQNAALAQVSSADLEVRRANPGLTALAVVGAIVGTAAVIAAVGMIYLAVAHPCFGLCGSLGGL